MFCPCTALQRRFTVASPGSGRLCTRADVGSTCTSTPLGSITSDADECYLIEPPGNTLHVHVKIKQGHDAGACQIEPEKQREKKQKEKKGKEARE